MRPNLSKYQQVCCSSLQVRTSLSIMNSTTPEVSHHPAGGDDVPRAGLYGLKNCVGKVCVGVPAVFGCSVVL